MKKSNFISALITVVILFYSTNSYSQITFQRTYGYGMMDMYSNLQQTNDDGFIVSGTSMESFWITFTGSVFKTQANGNISWAKNFNGVAIDNPWPIPDYDDDANYMINNVKQTSDNGYILTGQISPALLSLYVDYSDVFLIKTNSSGGVVWSNHYGGTDSDVGNFVMQTSDGGYLVAGYTYSFSAKDSTNIYILKTNSTGIITWDKTFQISAVDDDVAVTAEEVSDGFIIGGYSEQVNGADTLSDMALIKVNKSTGAVSWLKTYGLNSDDERIFDISLSTPTELLVTGYTNAPSGFNNTLLMKVNISDGSINSATSYYTGWLSMADEGHSIQNTSDGGIAIIGFSMSLLGAYSTLIKTDNTGNNISFSQAYNNGFAGMQFFSSGQQTNDGGYAIGNMGPGALAWDFGLIKTDVTGNSGCNESSLTPTQEACSFTPETPAYSPFSGSASNSFVPVVTNIIVTEAIICCSPGPDDAGTISGLTTVCQGQSGVTYSVPAIGNATGYNWTLPSGATIASGTNTNSITVNFSAGASSGNITVYGTNACGSGVASSLYITVNSIPAAAGAITGTSPVCQGQTNVTYTVPAISGAIGYTWTLPSGATIVSGAGTNSITVDFSASASSGNITVYGTNTCGNGTSSSFSVTVSSLPVDAGIITGTDTVCQGQSNVTYTVPTISGATGYNWTLPSGATIVSGTNTNSITVDFSGTAISGNITVSGTNTCGNGGASSFPVTVNTLPQTPGTITGDTTVCQNDLGTIYTVPLITGATGYNWTLPSGATIASGTNTNSITVDFAAGASSGNITVYGTNACGDGGASSLYITVNSVPATAGAITGTDTVCQGQSNVTYTVPSISGATGYNWALPSGAAIVSGAGTNSITVDFSASASSGNITVYGTNTCGDGTSSSFSVTVSSLPVDASIITGTDTVCQGQSNVTYTVPTISGATGYNWILPSGAIIVSGANTDSITVDFSGTAISGNITVSGTNACGNGGASSFPVTVNTLPQTPGTITGDTTVCQNDLGTIYTVPLITGATGYNWTLPSGATIASGTNTNSITVDFAAGASSGNITVYGTNACGNGGASSLYITINSIPAAAGAITGTDTVCQGQNGVTYSVPLISGATSYQWSLPSGAAIVSGAGTNSITVNFSASSSSGNITVYGTNYCGDGNISVLFPVTIKPLPSPAGVITGTQSFCEGTYGVDYSIAEITNATGYQWSVPTGAVIVSSTDTNSIVVDFPIGANSGNILVYGINDCGNGVSASFPVTVNEIPDIVITGDTVICENDGVTLLASGGSGYLWNTGDTTALMTDMPHINTSYSVTVTNVITGCLNTSSVAVSVYTNPTADAGMDKEVCYGSSITLNASGGLSYNWFPTTGLSDPLIANPESSPALNTIYTVEVTNSYGCTDIDSVVVTVNPLPQYSLISTNATCNDNNGNALLTIISASEPVSLLWSNGATVANINNLGMGVYHLTVSDAFNCVVYDSVEVNSENQLNCLEIPTLFSPNGDGTNDKFEISRIDLFPEAKVEIFNRWGNCIFKSDNYANSANWWDGTWNGKDMPMGAYIFILTLSSDKEPIQGIVSIVR